MRTLWKVEKLKWLRKSKGVTQAKLAEMLGVNKTRISAIESGARKPKADTLIKIAKALNVRLILDFDNEQFYFEDDR